MPRVTRLTLDKSEHCAPVTTTLPESVVAFLNAQSRKTLTSRASYVRAAILEKLARDGRLADDAEVTA